MIKIFAKKDTTEKVLIVCPRENVGKAQLKLNSKYGGNWLWVDKLTPQTEILKIR